MAAEHPEAERRYLGVVIRRRQVARILAELARPAASTALKLDGADLTEVNVFGAAGLRAGIELHLARDPSNWLSLIEPDNSECWEHLSDLLGLASDQRWNWAGTRSPAARGRNVLVPATLIKDGEDAGLIAEDAIPRAAGALNYGVRTSRLLQEAATVFLDNVEQHARSHAIPPVVCAAYHPPSNDMQIACVNLEDPLELMIATSTQLSDAIAKSRTEHGALDDLAARPRGGLVFTVRLMAGKGRARRRSDGYWRVEETAESISGFVAGLEVHRG